MRFAWVGMLVWLLGCTVSRKSSDFACQSTTDCDATRTCVQGYCVLRGDAGITQCPSTCDSCDLTTSPPTCTRTGQDGNDFTCPAGMSCTITCASSACGDIDCSDASCTIACMAGDACHDIQCGVGGCVVNCTGSGACHNVTCGVSGKGACDIRCTGIDACHDVDCHRSCGCAVTGCGLTECNSVSCPSTTGGDFCTESGSDGERCITSPPGCSC